MKHSVRLILMLVLACSALMLPAFADDTPEPNLAADATMSGNRPPMAIPHEVKDDADGTACNQCHAGSFKAPHPERLNCTQCHLPGAVKKVKKEKRK